jgi:hypothetical protein
MKLLGNDYRLWIESAVAGTYTEIKGQISTRVSRAGGLFDTSSKDDGAYGTQAPGSRGVTLDFEILPNLPDANGFTRLESRANASPAVPTKFEIRKAGSAGVGADAVFRANMYIGGFDTDYPKDAPVRCTGQLSLASPPELDTLG